MSVRIATSLRGRMRALASQGIFATDCYEQLHTLVLNHLGQEHAALLAEPQHNSQNDSVDWYAAGQGPAVPLTDLPPQEADTLRAKAGGLARDIRGLSESLTADAQARQALAGQMLRLALQHPAPEDLWSVDGRPVLVNWGFGPSSGSAQPQDLARLGPAAPAASGNARSRGPCSQAGLPALAAASASAAFAALASGRGSGAFTPAPAHGLHAGGPHGPYGRRTENRRPGGRTRPALAAAAGARGPVQASNAPRGGKEAGAGRAGAGSGYALLWRNAGNAAGTRQTQRTAQAAAQTQGRAQARGTAQTAAAEKKE